jgi:hypothetical protein
MRIIQRNSLNKEAFAINLHLILYFHLQIATGSEAALDY